MQPNRMQKLVGLVRKPLSGRAAAIAGIVLGLVGPLLKLGLVGLFTWDTGPYIFLGVGIILVFAIYWRMDRSVFRRGGIVALITAASLVLFAFGLAGSAWCYSHHVCMGGHMAHGPYPASDYALDILWAASLGLSVFWLYRVRSPLFVAVAATSAFLLSYRFVFGSFGGAYAWLPL